MNCPTRPCFIFSLIYLHQNLALSQLVAYIIIIFSAGTFLSKTSADYRVPVSWKNQKARFTFLRKFNKTLPEASVLGPKN